MSEDRPERRSPRLLGYDYTQNGAYFVTICTENRVCLFGEVVEGEMVLNTLGCVAEDCWRDIVKHFPHVELDEFVVMPNHVHGIVVIVDTPHNKIMAPSDVGKRPLVDNDVGTQHAASLPTQPKHQPGGVTPNNVASGSLSAVVRSYKSAVARLINRIRDTPGAKIWQGRYYDHIIRTEQGLNTLREYILHNPARWAEDQFKRLTT